jgi:nitrate reductase NapAB chaperone NapD
MAIAGLLVHTLKDRLLEVEAALKAAPGLTTYGTYENQFIVVVAEAPAAKMENLVEGLKDRDGVLTVYTTYVTIEDEVGNAPA